MKRRFLQRAESGHGSLRCIGLLLGLLALSWSVLALAAAPLGSSVPVPVAVLQLRPDFYMLTVDGVNLGLEAGKDGAVLVNPGPANASAAVIAQIKKLSSQPLRFIIDTSADPELIGGNASLRAAGRSNMINLYLLAKYHNDISAIPTDQLIAIGAPIIARAGVIEQMIGDSDSSSSTLAFPTEIFSRPQFVFRLNGQLIRVVRLPPAHSSVDSVVRFEGSDVVVTGATFDVTHFPVIDLKHGGSIQGEIAAMRKIIGTLVLASGPVVTDSDGTLVVPLRGYVCNQPELVTYLDMLSAIRDRVASLIARGDSLAKVEAAGPALPYATRYGSNSGRWTTRDFVAAVYRSLAARKSQARHGSGS